MDTEQGSAILPSRLARLAEYIDPWEPLHGLHVKDLPASQFWSRASNISVTAEVFQLMLLTEEELAAVQTRWPSIHQEMFFKAVRGLKYSALPRELRIIKVIEKDSQPWERMVYGEEMMMFLSYARDCI